MINADALTATFLGGNYVNNVEAAIWISVFERIDTIDQLPEFDRDAVHTVWITNGGHLRRKIQDDRLILRVLRKLLPTYNGEGIWVYRGECLFLYEQGKLGFCWTPKLEVATMFAKGLNALESGGVLIKAFAPLSAIIAGPNAHSRYLQEDEYTCDPTSLQSVEFLQRFPRP